MNVLIRKIYTMFHTPRIFMKKFAGSPLFSLLPDKLALQIQYRNVFGKKLDLKNPQTFNEKLQWLKLYNRRPEYTKMVDKYEAKKYVASIIGEEHIIPTLGVYDRFEDIDFEVLPDQFVLKCTHGSGDVVICRDKKSFDIEMARKKLTKALKTDFYKIGREWPYKNVPHKILVEKYMTPPGAVDINDYKFFCFNGKPEMLFVATDRTIDCKFDFFDMNFHHLDIENIHPCASQVIKKPRNFDKMKSLAEKISCGLCTARIDFYEIGDDVFFGEITLFHAGGFSTFHPDEWDEKLGKKIVLPKRFTNTQK